MISCTIRNLVFGLLVAALCFAAPGSLLAAALTIDDTAANETITIGANDWEFGLSLNGQPFQLGLNNPVSATVPEAGTLLFSGTWIAPGQQPVSGRIYLVEQLAGPLLSTTPISDIFQWDIVPNTADGTATITASFVSADDLGFLPVPIDPTTVFFEDGNPVNLGFVALGITLKSDMVPEPSSVTLAALGLVGLATMAYRRRKRSA